MKITIVQGPYYPVPPLLGSGVEKMWHGLGQEFACRGHSVVHLSRRYPTLPNAEVAAGVDYHRLPSIDAPKSKWMYRGYDLIYSLRAWRALPSGADILITNCMWLPLFVRSDRWGALCVHVARFPKGQMRLYRHARRIQTVSNAVAGQIARELGGKAENVRVIPPFLSNVPGKMECPPTTENRQRTILYLGRLHPEKGVHLLVGAFAQLRCEHWRLVIIGPHAYRHGGGGDGYYQQLRARAAGLGDQVVFKGLVEQGEINGYLESAATLVYPSLAETGESFGVVPLEAMARGCPVIVSDLACFRDYLVPGENGLVFNHRGDGALAELASALKYLLSDQGLRQKLAEAGYATSRDYLLEKIATRYLDDFQEIVYSRAATSKP